jgi:hypothetical protein
MASESSKNNIELLKEEPAKWPPEATQSTNVQNTQSVPKIVNVFDQNLHHINFSDNTLVGKLAPVEYEIECTNFGYKGYDPEPDVKYD